MKKYFATIYTDPLRDFHGFTHTFISLTHKSPDELENIDWYLYIYPSILENNKVGK